MSNAEADRQELEFDVLFVGGGPSCLAGAIHLARLAREMGAELSIGLVEKAANPGGHSLSGALVDPGPLFALFPDYFDRGFPIETPRIRDAHFLLAERGWRRLPLVPGFLRNENCFGASLSKMVAWLWERAEEEGVYCFSGFAGQHLLFDEKSKTVKGVRAGDKGRGRDGAPKANFEPGADLKAKIMVLGEGPRGTLLKELDEKVGIFAGRAPQVFETAIKEIIALPKGHPFLGGQANALHFAGFPLSGWARGGGFAYRMGENRVSLGLVLGLDYQDPAADPYSAFEAFKHHPLVAQAIKGGSVEAQGAKTLNTGGWYSIPRLYDNGVLVVGEAASLVDVRRLKGVHTAMESGMAAARTALAAILAGNVSAGALCAYPRLLAKSPYWGDLYAGRNTSAALAKKSRAGLVHLAAQFLTGGRGIADPLARKKDCRTLKPLGRVRAKAPVFGPFGHDTVLHLDKSTGVFLSGTKHEEDSPNHLHIPRPELCSSLCLKEFDCPCTRFCPGGVYTLSQTEQGPRLLVSPSNCLHCKTCDIKDPLGNIKWTCPEGGGGPNWRFM
jgi:electron-transferring-flavoprotein dehydrogenase